MPMSDEQIRARFAEVDGYIDAVDEKLVAIGRQLAAMSEGVEVLGRYVSTSVDALTQHLHDDHGH